MSDVSLKPRTDLKAILSLVLGLFSPVSFGATGLPALLLGFLSLRQINLSDGRLRGRGAAAAGMILGGSGLVLFVLGFVIVVIARLRERSDETVCRNNLGRIGLAVNLYHEEHGAFPAATIDAPLPPQKRLSWMAALLPYMRAAPLAAPAATGKSGSVPPHRGTKLFAQLDPAQGWEAEANRAVVTTSLDWFICPANPVRAGPGEPGIANYVGIAGLGADAASLPREDLRAGFFGHDRRITRADVTRGVSMTLLVTERQARHPWAAGGPATVAGLDPADRPYAGLGRPFGGLHSNGTLVLFVEGNVACWGPEVAPHLWEAHATIRPEP
jgi:hypothetical protein